MPQHYRAPSAKTAHVLIVFRDVWGMTGDYSHRALQVGAIHTVKVLRKNGIAADLVGIWPPESLYEVMKKWPTITHVVIEAPWIPTEVMVNLSIMFPAVHWIVRVHSQIGFLQVEPGAVTLMRDLLALQDASLNVQLAANNQQMANLVEELYQGDCLYLGTLYSLAQPRTKLAQEHRHRKLVIGSFGALRLLKNHSTAAAASMHIARRLRRDLEFLINVGREETAGCHDVLPTLRNMFEGLEWAKLIEVPWQSWSDFRRTISYCDLAMQPSLSETFNLVSADAIAEGVPVVGSDAIEWLPREWQARPDDMEDVARTGMGLLADPGAPADGMAALLAFQVTAIASWLTYLDSNPTV